MPARVEAIVDAAPSLQRIEGLLPIGVRPRQLSVATLFLGVLLSQVDGRPAHLTRVHQALVGLPEADRWRLGVIADWKSGPHLLTYRQTERTMALVIRVLEKEHPDGQPTETLQGVVDELVEASIPAEHKDASTSLAVDWTDAESFSARRRKPDGAYADPEAAWGHRKGGGPGEKDELFFGYYLSLATMVQDDGDPSVAELVRAMNLVSPDHDPVPAFVPVLEHLPDSGISLGDVVADSGYAHRIPEHFALPMRAAGASLVIDLHPHDRGTQGTHAGAIVGNGNLYCPATPTALFELGPLSRQATGEETTAHDAKTAELARYKLGRITSDDKDGYHRVACPAVMGKCRCPLRPDSMALSFDRPEVLAPPEEAPACCTQQSITVPPSVNAKTAQKHDYSSAAHRRSYARRSAAERSNARIKDPATIDVARGWCRNAHHQHVPRLCPRRAQPRRCRRLRQAPRGRPAQGAGRPSTEDPATPAQDHPRSGGRVFRRTAVVEPPFACRSQPGVDERVPTKIPDLQGLGFRSFTPTATSPI
ncbi:MAG: hypothetical protein ACYCV7_00665 [Acidimicrobiales bacterium]